MSHLLFLAACCFLSAFFKKMFFRFTFRNLQETLSNLVWSKLVETLFILFIIVAQEQSFSVAASYRYKHLESFSPSSLQMIWSKSLEVSLQVILLTVSVQSSCAGGLQMFRCGGFLSNGQKYFKDAFFLSFSGS